jgi:hypothetical protein
MSKPEVEGPQFLGCLQQFLQHIQGYCPYLEAVTHDKGYS